MPVLCCDPDGTTRTAAAFTEQFGADRIRQLAPAAGSEDVGHFGAALGVPTVFWFWGGGDPEQFKQAMAAGRFDQDVPYNHSPRFAPVPEPTIATGVEALATAALNWLKT
jgi:hippurate hydrolase